MFDRLIYKRKHFRRSGCHENESGNVFANLLTQPFKRLINRSQSRERSICNILFFTYWNAENMIEKINNKCNKSQFKIKTDRIITFLLLYNITL